MRDSDHLQWLHNRIVNHYKEDINVDFLWRLREIIAKQVTMERVIDDFKFLGILK